MRRANQPDLGGRPLYSIHIGGMSASHRPSVVRTVLGSCISVCLRDPVVQAGGMNHFMLPSCASGETVSARYGVHAMELLINACMHAGADRRRLEAKVFGGGHVLRIRETEGNVPQINIKFALEFLERESIPILSRDLGDYAAREVYFFTDSGRVCLKRLSPTGGLDAREIAELEREEREERIIPRRPASLSAPALDDSNVTLF